jgi:acyl carrier protein
MVPGSYVKLESLPLTENGKLDRRALPDPELKKETYEEPENEVEEKIRAIFAGVLGLAEEEISVRADFFRLGGDSIRSIQLVNRVQRQLQLSITIKDIFACRTIRNLYENLFSMAKTSRSIKNEQGILTGAFPLLPSQKYFFDIMGVHKMTMEYYNSYVSTYLVAIDDADEDILLNSVVKLVEYHDAFRLRYEQTQDNAYVQHYSTMPEIKFHRIDISALNAHEREKKINQAAASWIATINIFSDNLILFGIVTGFEDKSVQLYLLSHHLNTDGVSWRIVADDLKTIYNHLLQHKTEKKNIPVEDILGPKGTSLRQWVTALLTYKEQVENEKAYWEDIEQAAVVSNRAIAALSYCTMRKRQIDLGEELTGKLLKASHQGLETRIDDILLSALNLALYKMTGIESHCIMMESHGRHEIAGDLDVSRTMGWFAVPYPIKLPQVDKDIEAATNRVKEMLRKIPNGGIGYRLLCEENGNRCLPAIYVNYQGEFESSMDLDIEGPMIDEIFQYDMELIGHVFNQRLVFMFLSKLADDRVLKFTEDFKDALKMVIAAFEF